jgi:CelD/BcsL family acetyltransferase involved in cellulose biosynthesis
MSEPIINVTAQGNRLNEAAAIALAQEHGVVDPSGQQVVNYSHALFDAIEFQEGQQRQAAIAEHAITSELDLVQHVQHLIDKAAAVGYKFTVTLNADGKPIPAAMKA